MPDRTKDPLLRDRFKGAKAGTLWYYLELGKAYRAAGATGYLIEELEATVRELRELARAH